MCLAVPGKIVKIKEENSERIAEVDFGGIIKDINITLTPEAEIGKYIIAHVGVALSVIDEEEAQETFDYLKKIGLSG
jgi:hydrogenase expression/formation protein HypC